ncbi:hypothetical protein MKUB_30880 [Mycobacterium kubicae]|uniref:Uncharacterized protein n=1 Tax=Mycobacterium kubicae TaxID=120959 RepID=A0AAX1J976_9MYCO|nr:hypothetical protein [Mycobacterium kubicae]MCV7094340.1 hypothetical protein [Mycobacterium kubicae]ORV98986.1 hypothetical protein AWC13_12380 [Mycobacterium kubicae]QNI09860.1 hypothetical protein GAN18_00230 [Mycobacterium kubicae]QPI38058.1 hypothetical protein I2456_00210 [Mycobacterium kubicae]GFG65598.1 hypothetical protein MKUB_30880 [Mycobacterium kubicae]
MLGAAFKLLSDDDLRDLPALNIAGELQEQGEHVRPSQRAVLRQVGRRGHKIDEAMSRGFHGEMARRFGDYR